MIYCVDKTDNFGKLCRYSEVCALHVLCFKCVFKPQTKVLVNYKILTNMHHDENMTVCTKLADKAKRSSRVTPKWFGTILWGPWQSGECDKLLIRLITLQTLDNVLETILICLAEICTKSSCLLCFMCLFCDFFFFLQLPLNPTLRQNTTDVVSTWRVCLVWNQASLMFTKWAHSV